MDVRDCAAGHINLLESHTVANGDRHLMISTDKVLMEDLTACMGEVFKNSPLDPTTTAEVDPHPDMDEAQKAWFRQVWDGVELRNEVSSPLLSLPSGLHSSQDDSGIVAGRRRHGRACPFDR